MQDHTVLKSGWRKYLHCKKLNKQLTNCISNVYTNLNPLCKVSNIHTDFNPLCKILNIHTDFNPFYKLSNKYISFNP